MLKKLGIFIAVLLGLAFVVCGYFWYGSWKLRQETLEELGPVLADEQEKDELLALGEVDLNPSDLTLATLEQRLKTPVQKQPGDLNSTRVGWVCGKESCAIWATFLVPVGQDIPPNTVPGSNHQESHAGRFSEYKNRRNPSWGLRPEARRAFERR